jgi:hypothetical protein
LVLGVLQGANVVPLFLLARRLLPPDLQRGTPWFALFTAFVGATGATQLSELGSSFGDNLVSVPLLCAFALAFAVERFAMRRLLIAAALAGAIAGIKLTAAPFALGLVLALPLLTHERAASWRMLGLGGVAAALGFLATNGFWMWRLWQDFGNPFHPLFGSVFGGDYAPPMSLRDARWPPRTALEWLAYPLVWAAGSPRRVLEEWFLDLRVPLAFVALALLAWLARRRTGQGDATLRALVWALGIAYAAWLALFGYYRYLAPLEMLAPLLLSLALARVARARARHIAALLLGVLLLFTRPPHWGRLPENGERFLHIELPAVPQLDRATVVLPDGEPLSFLALGFPPGAHFVRVGGGLLGPPMPEYGMDRAASRHLAAAQGPLYALLLDPDSRGAPMALARQCLVRTDACAPVRNNLLGRDAWLCPLRREP